MEDNVKNLGKVCITPEGVWDVNKEYDRLSLVVTSDADTQRVLSYVSRKHVPKGNINIKDTEYWQLFTTELKLEDITIDENGNVKIGDVVIYQIPLGDALGEIVVDKIKTDLTNHIMTEIRSYMNGMVTELINSFSNQIGRLIDNGFEIRNRLSGEVNAKHSGTINVNVNGDSESDDDEFIFTTDTPNIDITSSSQWKQISVNSEQNETPVEFSALHFPNWVEVLTIPSNPTTVSSLVNIKFKENTDENSRGDNIILQQNGSNKTLTISVIQRGASSEPVNPDNPDNPSDTYVFTANPNVINFNDAGTSNVAVTSTKNGNSIGYTASSANNWASFNNGVVTVLANNTPGSRSTTITLTQNESNKTITITVNQAAGEFYEVTVVRDPDSNLPQLLGLTINGQQLQSKNFAPGSYVTIRVHPEGYSEAVREFSVYSHTTLIVTDDESKQGDNYIYVRQGSNYTYVFHTENTQINLNSNNTSLQIPVTSTKDGAFIGYTARTLNNANWITGINVPVDSNTSLTITLTANNTNSARNETIVLKQNETNNVIQIYITQAAPSSGEGGNNGDSGSGSGGNYVFRTNNLSGSIDVDANLSSAHDIVSTKNGNFQPFSLTSKPNWTNVSINGNTVTISADKNRITTARNGNVVLTQSESNNTITIQVTQAGLNPPLIGSDFVAMLIDNNGAETEQNLSDRITLNSNDLYKVLVPKFKSNGSLSQDTVTITSADYAPNAANTDKFNINLSSTGLSIAPVANLSESVTTSYEIFVSYNEYSERYVFEIAYNA